MNEITISDSVTWLEDNSYLQEGTNLFTWPFPNEAEVDPQFYKMMEKPEVETSYTAVGRTGGWVKGFHRRNEKVESLDVLEPTERASEESSKLLEGPVTSYDVAEMSRKGVLEEELFGNIDIEYARDFGMAFDYNPEYVQEQRKIRTDSETSEEKMERLEESNTEFLQKLAEESSNITDKVSILDLHDFGISGVQLTPIRHEHGTDYEAIDEAHQERVAEVYDDHFEDVTAAVIKEENNGEEYVARRYVIAEEPLDS